MPDGVTSPPHTEIQVGVLADWLAAQTGADRVHIDPLVLLP
ncbi:MAG: hypothetical protein ACI8S3_002448, partial [Alphaproteobacteria bacterium]